MSMDGSGYIIPSEIAPEGVRCVILEIPDDQLHIAAFWGQIGMLAKWYTWARDHDKQGKDVAAVWQAVIAKAREQWEMGACGLQVRQSPIEPCILEQSTDGGATWVQFADVSLCGVTPSPPYEPGTEGSQRDSAAATVDYLNEIYCIVSDGIGNGDTDEEIIATIQAHWVGALNETPTAASLQPIIDAVRSASPEDRAAACGGDWTDDVFEAAICNTFVAPDEFGGGWLDRAANGIADWLNDRAQWLIDAVENTADLLGLQHHNTLATEAGAGGGGDYGSITCVWEHTIDLTEGVGPWAVVHGEWQPDTGVIDGDVKQTLVWRRAARLRYNAPFAFSIYEYEATYDFVEGATINSSYATEAIVIDGTYYHMLTFATTTNGTPKVRGETADRDVGGWLEIFVRPSEMNSAASLTGWAILKSVTIRGYGSNPFEWGGF